jgi:hypothetical protein
LSFTLVLTFSWQCSAKSIIYFHFKYNQKQLAETLCENKNKPKSCCEAKCYLEKEIKKEEKRENELPGNLKDKIEKNEQSGSTCHLLIYLKQTNILKFDSYHSNYSFAHIAFVFHPPAN